MERPLRILHILNTPRAEGTPNLCLDWLRTPGAEQHLLCLNGEPPDLLAELRGAAATIEVRDCFRHGARKFIFIFRAVREAVERHRPDWILAWPLGFAPWIAPACVAAGAAPVIFHAGNPPERSARWLLQSLYIHWPIFLLRADVVCCSNYVRDRIAANPLVLPGPLSVVHNCVRQAEIVAGAARGRAARADRPRPVAIMVATLERHKDHATLIRAVALLQTALPELEVRLAGEGSLRGELQQLAADLGVQGQVKFLGRRTDVPELLGASDLFVFSTTLQEGLGTVIFEALAAGVAVVTSDVPACREALRDGRDGRLVAANSPEALAAAMLAHFRRPEAAPAGPVPMSPLRMRGHYTAVVRDRISRLETVL